MSEILQPILPDTRFSCSYVENEAVAMHEGIQRAGNFLREGFDYTREHWKIALSIGLLGIWGYTQRESAGINDQKLATQLSSTGIVYEFHPFAAKEAKAQGPYDQPPHLGDVKPRWRVTEQPWNPHGSYWPVYRSQWIQSVNGQYHYSYPNQYGGGYYWNGRNLGYIGPRHPRYNRYYGY